LTPRHTSGLMNNPPFDSTMSSRTMSAEAVPELSSPCFTLYRSTQNCTWKGPLSSHFHRNRHLRCVR